MLQYVSVILLLRVIRALVILRVILIKRNAITSSALSLSRSSSADNSLRLFTSHIMQYVHQEHNKWLGEISLKLQNYETLVKWITSFQCRVTENYFERLRFCYIPSIINPCMNICFRKFRKNHLSSLVNFIALQCLWGNTDGFTTMPFHIVLSSGALAVQAKSILAPPLPTQSPLWPLLLYSHCFFCLSLSTSLFSSRFPVELSF